MNEARREKRAPLKLAVEVSGEDASGAEFTHPARTINISGGGVCFESPRNLLVGTRLLLQIQIPPPLRGHFGGQDVYRARAVVCRVEHLEGQPVSRVSARFLPDAVMADPPGRTSL